MMDNPVAADRVTQRAPEVSVVMPTFNAADTVGRAVQSILDQSLQDLELVVVDDGSTDNTVDVVREFSDPRIQLLECEHRGVVAAANTATQAASSALIARMDADDFAYPNRLELQRQLLLERDFDVVGCRVRIIQQDCERSASMARYERWINEETLESDQIASLRFIELPIVNPTILARREYFELGFRDGGFPEDYDLMLRAAAAEMRFGKVDEVLFDWIDHDGRVTRSDPRYSSDAFMACRGQHLLDGPLKQIDTVDLWGVGQTGKPWLRWLIDQGLQIRNCYDIDDRKIGQAIHGAIIKHPETLYATDGTPLIIAVGADNARTTIMPQLQAKGFTPGVDAWFVA